MSENQNEAVCLKPGFVYQPIASEEVGSLGVGPLIDARGMSDEQIFDWMDKKLVAAKRLRDLLSTKAAIEEQLIHLNSEIEHATLLSQIEVYRKD
ncbi:hypothetical protein [Enterobacter hormaechei]|uniref:hypothetical protein n=1 Tax=Enterobacter hormaechei TaxID=158836 RepID=UPI00111326BA|nr:hypothetical protein [Enterobacter hormaechei]